VLSDAFLGMYNTPGMTTTWALGGLIRLGWVKWKGQGEENTIILAASGLMLGQGIAQLFIDAM
jgi:uncharacterized oligopeptide transporter (OPT) family protein